MKKDKRFWFGVLLTVGWLGYMCWQWATGEMPAKLNERGDFFAGFFAPLAFLWLVLGYLQQGEELRQSSEALRLQAEELKNSVAQQTELVAVSRKQLEQEAEALKDERRRLAQAARPIFTLRCASGSYGETSAEYSFVMTNTGNTATNIMIEMDLDNQELRQEIGMMQRNDARDILGKFWLSYGVKATMTASYVDADGREGVQSIEVHSRRQGPLHKDVFELVL